VRRSHPQVARQREFRAAAEREAVQRRDGRHREGADRVERRGALCGERFGRLGLAHRRELGEVPARAERDLAGAGDQREAQVGVRGVRLEDHLQLPERLARERVALARTVDRHAEHAAVVGAQAVRHRVRGAAKSAARV